MDENVNDQNFYENLGQFDAYWPFENNYRYRNFVFNSPELDANGRITTGAGGDYYENSIPIPPFGGFNPGLDLLYPNPITYQFQPPATNGAPISALLATNQTKWLATYALDSDFSWLWKIGATNSGGVNGLFNNVRNWYGLPIRSVSIAYNVGSGLVTNVLTAGNTTLMAESVSRAESTGPDRSVGGESLSVEAAQALANALLPMMKTDELNAVDPAVFARYLQLAGLHMGSTDVRSRPRAQQLDLPIWLQISDRSVSNVVAMDNHAFSYLLWKEFVETYPNFRTFYTPTTLLE